MDTKELKELSIALMDAVKQRGISVFEVKNDDFELHIELPAMAAPAASVSAAVQTVTDAAAAPQEETISGTPVEAPLVGVFYSAPGTGGASVY